MTNKQTTFENSEIETLSRVLEEALKATIDSEQISDDQLQQLGSRLGRVIWDRYAAGETNPEVLKRIAVESMRASRVM